MNDILIIINLYVLGDLLHIDLGPSMPFQAPQAAPPPAGGSVMDLMGEGLDSLLGAGGIPAQDTMGPGTGGVAGLGDIFSVSSHQTYVPPQEIWLPAAKGKGLEISGTFAKKAPSQLVMELTLSNKAMQPMSGFAIQFNKNSFGIIPAQQLNLQNPLMPNTTINVTLPLNTAGPVQRMEPLNNLQVAVKNNIDVFYFSCLVPMHVLFVEDGEMDKRVFLATWKDIPTTNEVQFDINNVEHNGDTVSQKLKNNSIFTIAKRNVEGQDMLYQSLKLTNGIWVLAELKIAPGNPNFTLSLKSRALDVYNGIHQAYDVILHQA